MLSVPLFAAMPVSMVHAQSFDCQKAADLVDKTICTTPELSALDAQLGVAWQSFRAQRPDLVQQAKGEGLVWFRQRKLYASSPDVVGCIRDLESARIQKLKVSMTTPDAMPSPNKTLTRVQQSEFPELYNNLDTICDNDGHPCTQKEFDNLLPGAHRQWNAMPEWLQVACHASQTLARMAKCIVDKTMDYLNEDLGRKAPWLDPDLYK